MPGEDREKFNLDFGIEETITEAGDPEVISALWGGGTIGDPNSVKTKEEKEKEDAEKKKKSSTTTPNTTQPALKKDKEEEIIDVEGLTLGDNEEGTTTQELSEEQENEGAGKGEKTPFANLAADFMEMGIFEKPEEGKELPDDLTPEQFMELYQANNNRVINDTINGFLGKYGDDYRDVFDAIFVKGVNPREYLSAFVKLEDIASLDMTQTASHEKVYKEYFRRQGFDEAKVEAKLQRAKVNGELEEDSIDFHKILVEQDAKDLETKTKVKEEKTLNDRRQKQVFAQSANKVLIEKAKEKEFDGIPLTDQIAKSTFDYLTQEKYVLPSGEPLTEFDKFILDLKRPENASLKVKIALLAQSGFDLTKVKIKEKNDATRQAFTWATKGKPDKSTPTKVSTQKKEENFI